MTLKKLKKYKLFRKEELLSLELLENQGFCNINYLLTSSKRKYIVRKFKNNETVNISRKYEFKIQKKASKINLASKPLFLDIKNGFMVCHYLEGNHKSELKNKEIKKLAKNIKKLHSIKSNKKKYDLKKDLQQYKKNLKNKEAKKSILICTKEIKKLKKSKTYLVTTHHDLNPKNILFYKNNIKFIDWEYVGANDIYFDLATVSFEFQFNKKQKNLLLNTYFKKCRKKEQKKLTSYILIYKNLCNLWFMSL